MRRLSVIFTTDYTQDCQSYMLFNRLTYWGFTPMIFLRGNSGQDKCDLCPIFYHAADRSAPLNRPKWSISAHSQYNYTYSSSPFHHSHTGKSIPIKGSISGVIYHLNCKCGKSQVYKTTKELKHMWQITGLVLHARTQIILSFCILLYGGIEKVSLPERER